MLLDLLKTLVICVALAPVVILAPFVVLGRAADWAANWWYKHVVNPLVDYFDLDY